MVTPAPSAPSWIPNWSASRQIDGLPGALFFSQKTYQLVG
jgi:hypothetical protein